MRPDLRPNPDERRFSSPGDKENVDPRDWRLADLANRQYGVVARRQLLAIGLNDVMVHDRVRRGQFVRLHRGVYAVGHRQLRREGHWMAAVLAAGEGAALSHRDAAALHGLLRPGSHVRVEVTTAGRATTTARIRVYRSPSLDAEDITTVRGIPTATVARTLVDLADILPTDRLAKAMNEAERLHLLDVKALERTLARTKGRHGKGHQRVRNALERLQALGVTFTRSHLEDLFLSLVVKRYGLSRPTMNGGVEGMEVDALWRDHRLVVELDGWGSHNSKHAFQEDRERDVRLGLAGFEVMRFTYADVTNRPAWVAQSIRGKLAARSAMLAGAQPAPSAARATMSRPACP